MTINELEQGLRNLITSDPAVLSGNLGEVVRGVMGVAEAYRNYIFHVQSYPVQDVFKFSLLSETGKLENNITGLACAMLQERGINLLLYIPQNVPPYNGQFASGYNPAMGQMAFNPNSAMGYNSLQNSSYMSVMPNVNPMFGKQNSVLQSMGQPVMNSNSAKPKASSTAFSGYQPTGKPTFASNGKLDDKSDLTKQTVSASTGNLSEKSSVEINFNNFDNKNDSQVDDLLNDNSKNSPASTLLDEGSSSSDKAAVGRDYLLELLKK